MTASVLIVGMLALASCSASTVGAPPVTPISTPSATTTPTPTPDVDIAEGTRANPLEVGESRKLSSDSSWSVGATGPTQVGADYVVLPVQIDIDWDATRAQGGDPDNDGVDPWAYVLFEYVTAGGKGYDTNTRPSSVDVPDELFNVGTVYPPTTTVTGNVVIGVPSAEASGGVWRVSNLRDDAIFIVGAP